jgi:hypothetical protein
MKNIIERQSELDNIRETQNAESPIFTDVETKKLRQLLSPIQFTNAEIRHLQEELTNLAGLYKIHVDQRSISIISDTCSGTAVRTIFIFEDQESPDYYTYIAIGVDGDEFSAKKYGIQSVQRYEILMATTWQKEIDCFECEIGTDYNDESDDESNDESDDESDDTPNTLTIEELADLYVWEYPHILQIADMITRRLARFYAVMEKDGDCANIEAEDEENGVKYIINIDCFGLGLIIQHKGVIHCIDDSEILIENWLTAPIECLKKEFALAEKDGAFDDEDESDESHDESDDE